LIVLKAKATASASSNLLRRGARREDRTHIVSPDGLFARQFPQQAQGRSQRLADGCRVEIGEHRGDLRAVAIGSRRDGSVRLDAKFARVHLRHERGHQLAVAD
jgi:hypothetical protein